MCEGEELICVPFISDDLPKAVEHAIVAVLADAFAGLNLSMFV
jgi:hypothetical protein